MTLDEFIRNKHGGGGGNSSAAVATSTPKASSPLDEFIRSKHDPNYTPVSQPVETTPSPATYKAGSGIVDALAGVTGRKAEPYTPKPVVNPEPTRQQRRAEMLDEQFTPTPVKNPEPPTMPNRIVSDAGMNFSNSAQALFNAAPVASERGQGLNPVTPYEAQEQQEKAQNDFNDLNRQIQEYDLALGMADTPEAQAEINAKRAPLVEQRERLLQENPSITDYDKAQSKAFWGAINTGNDAALSRITTFLDKTIGLGDALQEVFYMFGINRDNPIKAFNNYVHKVAEHNQEYYKEQTKGDPTAQAILNYGGQTVAAVPAMLFAMATAGASTAGTAGLEATAYLNSLSGAEQTMYQVSNAVNTMMANPSWQLSFAQEAGSAYESALDKGLDEAEAAVYSTLYGYLSATVEVGGTSEAAGGLEQYYKDVKKGNISNGLIARAKEIAGEIGEENIQGMLERGLLGLFGQDTAVYSKDPNQNAIIQPQQMWEEAKGAAIVSALLGIPGSVSNINSRATVDAETAPVATQSVEAAPVETPVEVQEAPAPAYTSAQEQVIDLLTQPNGVKFSDANRILSDATLWDAFQSLFPNVDTNQSRTNLKEEIRTADLSTIASPEEANPIAESNTPNALDALETETPNAESVETVAEAPVEAPVETPAAETPVEAPPAETRPVEVEQPLEPGMRERGESRTLRNDASRNEALRNFKKKNRDLYKQLKNSETLKKALDIYENGYDSALLEVQTAIRNAQDGKKLSPEIVPLSKMVCDEMAARGDIEGANRIYSDIGAELTYAGQLGQANAILKGASVTAKADAMQKTLMKIAKDANADISAERITEIGNAFKAADTDEARNAIIDDAIKEIANMSPTTLREAFTALRYMNMLGNFKTQFRNILGNTGMLAVSRAKNRVAALGQMSANAISNLLTGEDVVERTNTLTTDAKLYKEAAELYEEDRADTLGEGKYSDVAQKNKAVADAKTIFKWNWKGEASNAFEQWFRTVADMPLKVLEKYRKLTGWAMDAGDAIFTRITYSQTLADYAKAQGYKSLSDIDPDTLNQMRQYAIQQAQEATFRDTNAVSDFVSTFDSNWGQKGWVGKAAQTVVRGIVPFRKTPANVGVRMFEYSPLEIISTAVDAVRLAKGDANVTANDVIDDVAKTLTGTSLAALGFIMAKSGLFGLKARGKEEDKDLESFEKGTQSMADYSLVLPDGTTVSMDWLTPESGAYFLGVAAADALEDGAQWEDFLTLLGATSDVALNMSFLSGIQDALNNLNSFNNDISALPQFLLNSFLSFIGQATTNSLVGQAEQASEQNRQTTYTNPDDIVPKGLQYSVGKASAKTPGWDYNQADYIDAWGRKQDNGPAAARIAEAFFSPAYVNEDRSTPVDDELKRLYEATGENVLPAVTSRSGNVNGTRFTPEEYETYQTTLGQRSLALVTSLINGRGWDELSDSEKADAIKDMYSWAKAEAKNSVLEMRGEETSPVTNEDKAKAIMDAGKMTFAEYYKFDDDLDTYCGGGVPSQDELISFLDEGGYKNPDKIYSAILPNAKTSYADAKAKIEEAKAQEAEYQKAGWKSTEQFKQDQSAMAEFKTEQKNQYDTSSMVAISNYIRNADRTDEQKDMLMADSSNAFSKSYAAIRAEGDMTANEVIDLLLAIDNTATSTATPGNGSIAQAELKAYYREHPEANDVLSIIFGVIKPDGDWETAKAKK